MATLAEILRQTGYSQDGTLAAPAPIEPTMTSILQKHIASIPQKFNKNQAAQMDLLARAYPGNTFKSMMTEGDNKALAELAMQVPFNALTAFHGTPHKIVGKFDINKVGTGEGAQSYGHGMYFAENPAVATEYKNMLGSKIDVNGKPLYNANKTIGSTGNTELDDYLVANLGDVKATRKQLLNDIKEIRPTNPEAAKEMQTTLADLRKANVGVQNTGNLYKVDIPDEHIPNMLDWDKSFKDQTPSVQAAIKQLEPKIKQINPNLNIENLDGKGIYHAYQQYRGNQPDFASEGMNELGIKGIRYLDQGSRTPGFSSLTPTQLQSRIESLQTDIKSGAGNTQKMKDQLKGLQNELDSYSNMTSNFVVFDPSTVKILEENAKPISRKALIEKQVKDLKD